LSLPSHRIFVLIEEVFDVVISLLGGLKMFNELSSLCRLSLCLLLSGSVHGGLAFYDWMPPAESRLVHAPVAVSLLPAIDIALPVLEEKSQTPPETVPVSSTSHVVAARQPRVDSQPKPSVSRVPASKTLPTKPLLAVAADEPKRKLAPVESACAAPQEVIDETLFELFADSQPEAALTGFDTALTGSDTATDNVVIEKRQVSQPSVVKGLLNSFPVSATQPLIEAFPNYRSNPLPKYPHLARQKHWQGVVWLLVDVSADGLVVDLRLEKSCGYRVLDKAASQAVRRWKFSPARRAGLVVESQVRIPVRFRLEDG
jgi:protein TonB